MHAAPKPPNEAEVRDAAATLLRALGLDLDDDNLRETPRRIARMYVQELCAGLYEPPPEMTTFPSNGRHDQMVTVGPLVLHSLCPHHFAPILGRAWIGVVPGARLLGLSKYARLVRWCAARPIMQEDLTMLIADELDRVLGETVGVGVVVKAEHLCMKWRGVREDHAVTTTSVMRGQFMDSEATRAEFMRLIA